MLTVSNGADHGGGGDVTNTYSADGTLAGVKDAKNQVYGYFYDGHGHVRTLLYPDPTTGGTNYNDIENYLYDFGGNLVRRWVRTGHQISLGYDALNRLTATTFPSKTYAYDDGGRLTLVTGGSESQSYTYDALGRVLTSTGLGGTISYQYDAAGRRTRMTWPDSFYVTYDYDNVGHMTAIKEEGSANLVTFTYDYLGRRKRKVFFNGQSTVYGYDSGSRLVELNFPLWPHSIQLTYDDANRIKTKIGTSSDFVWNGHQPIDRTYNLDAVNKLTTSNATPGGATSYSYDNNGNLRSDGASATYTFDRINRITAGSNGATMTYDAMDRLWGVFQGGSGERFQYDGDKMVAEYQDADHGGAMLRRYIHGPGADEPLIWYEGSGKTNKRSLMADERGSITVVSEANGNTLAVRSYDEYGNGAVTGRFGYTGQAWIPQIGQYYYKARIYAPTIGRFMQTDPLRLGDGVNMYAYVAGDPINYVDPTGQQNTYRGETIVDGVLINAGATAFAGGGGPLIDFLYTTMMGPQMRSCRRVSTSAVPKGVKVQVIIGIQPTGCAGLLRRLR